jgi:hypothetical protein
MVSRTHGKGNHTGMRMDRSKAKVWRPSEYGISQSSYTHTILNVTSPDLPDCADTLTLDSPDGPHFQLTDVQARQLHGASVWVGPGYAVGVSVAPGLPQWRLRAFTIASVQSVRGSVATSVWAWVTFGVICGRVWSALNHKIYNMCSVHYD